MKDFIVVGKFYPNQNENSEYGNEKKSDSNSDNDEGNKVNGT